MKTNSSRPVRVSRPMKIALIVLTVLLLAGLVFILLEKFQITNFINQQKTTELIDSQLVINNDPPTTEQKAAGELQKQKANNAVTNNDLGISITSINTSSDPLQIRGTISGTISNSGNCTLNLTKGDQLVTKTSGTYALPSSSTCKGFDISKSELGIGEWQLELIVDINEKQSSVTDSFILE